MDDLIKRFKELPETKKEDESIFSICGFPHYERVTSNVLAFFLNNQREHGLGNLFIESLLSLSKIPIEGFDLNYQVEIETPTTKGKFIDLDILGNDYRIIIENKIFAPLYNDLEEYYNFASKKNTKVIAYVLSLFPQPPELKHKYKKYLFITYEMLFEEIRKRIGEFMTDSNQRYLPLLFDFMKNIENLKRGNVMDLEFIDFVKENQKDVEKINIRLKQLHDDLRKIVQSVNSTVFDKFGSEKIKQWPYRALPGIFDTAVSEIKLENEVVIIDATINLPGWSFEIFMRKPSAVFVLESYLDLIGIKYAINAKGRCQLPQNYNINESKFVIANFIIELIENILKGY